MIRRARASFADTDRSHTDGPYRPFRGPSEAAVLVCAAIAALFALLAIAAPGASAAAPPHIRKETFGGLTPPTLAEPTGMAVDQSNGDLYVIEHEAGAVSRWKPNGTPDNFSSLGTNQIAGFSFGVPKETQIAVDSSSGKIYVVSLTEGVVHIYNSDGSSAGELTSSSSGAFGEACGVAVDPSGHVYVADAAKKKIDKFGSPPVNGTTEEEIAVNGGEPCLIGVGAGASAGYLFAAGYFGGVFKVKTGSEEEVTPTEAVGLSVDPGTGHVYQSSSEVKEYDPSASPAVEVSSTALSAESLGVAVNATTGDIYVDETGSSQIEVYEPFTKMVTITPIGNGQVECKDLASSGNFGPCAATYPEAHTIKLKAAPANGSSFGGWSEFSGSGTVTTACAGAVVECEVNMAADVSGKATFQANPTADLKVTKGGSGSGSVSSIPGGISCGSVCEDAFQLGKAITLEAAADPGSAFVEWTGCDSVAGTACHLNFNGARTVGAVFTKVQHSLTINKAGTGGGSVSCNGGACAGSYPEGATVTLTAAPDSGSTFAGWSGGGCSGSGSCAVTINADTTVAATFDAKQASSSPPPAPCVATIGTSASVTGGQASLKLTCPASSANAGGKITLKAKVKQGKNQKTVPVGTASISVAAGKSATVKVKITNGQVKKQLNDGKIVKVQVSGPSVKTTTVKLKTAGSGVKGANRK